MRLRLLLVAILGLASVGWATPIWVDTFDVTSQFVVYPPTFPWSSSSTVPASEAEGGWRTMTVARTGGPRSVRGDVSFGLLSLSTDRDTIGNLTVTWDGNSPSGFTPVDLLGGGNEVFLSAGSDVGLTGTLTMSSAGGSSSRAFPIPAAGSGMILIALPFSSFAANPGGGADFHAITKVQLVMSGTSDADASVDYIGIGLPEPMTLLLIGSGLVGLGLLRRRLRRVS